MELVLPSLVAVAILVAAVVLAPRGLDLMDESYVLRLVLHPQSSKAAGEVYLFAFLVHPLMNLLSGDIAQFRILGIGALGLLAALTCRDSVRLAAGPTAAKGLALACVLPAGAASLLVFTLGVRVPGYRTVALAGLLLVAWGLAKRGLDSALSGGLMVGLGGWLTFAGKPTSAAALLVLLLVCSGRFALWTRRFVGGAVIGCVVGLSVTLAAAQMSLTEATGYLARGATLVDLLGDHPSMVRMFGIGPVRVEAFLIFGAPLVVAVILTSLIRRRVKPPVRPIVDAVGALSMLLVAGLAARMAAEVLGPRTQGLQILPLALVLPVLALGAMRAFLSQPRNTEARYVRDLVLTLLVLPWVFAVGSNVSLAMTTAQAGVLWMIALATAVAFNGQEQAVTPDRAARLGRYLTAATCVVGVIVYVGYADGPGGPQLSQARDPSVVAGGTLQLKSSDAELADGLHRLAIQEGIGSDTPVVDLTGMGAGYALMLGGRPLGRAHLYGTWSGRVDSARFALERQKCTDLASAWLIYARDNPSDVSGVLADLGLSLRRDYSAVYSFEAEQYGQRWTMEVLRPNPALSSTLDC